MTDTTYSPLTGIWLPNQLSSLYYGPGSVHKHLFSALPTPQSKAYIVTTTSLATKTPLVNQVETLLGASHHAGTFTKISQHAPIAQIEEAASLVGGGSDPGNPQVDTVISLGGGSPIDSAKAIAHILHDKSPNKDKDKAGFLHHIAIPTTLSVAEVTGIAGYTSPEGVKSMFRSPSLVPKTVIYDADFIAGHTPPALFYRPASAR